MQELKERYINRDPLAHSWNRRFTLYETRWLEAYAGRMLQTESIAILYECRPPSRQKDTSIRETNASYGIAKVELRKPEPGIELDPCNHSAALSRIRVQRIRYVWRNGGRHLPVRDARSETWLE